MDILFANGKLADTCSKVRVRRKAFGQRKAKILGRRLDDLDAAETLSHMRQLPGRCRELKAKRKGQLAIELDGPYKLIFEPAHNPTPTKPDGGLDWSSVNKVRILEVGEING